MPVRRTFALDRTFTHRLHTLNKLTDRVSQQAYLRELGLALGESRCLGSVGAFGPLSVNDLATHANLTKGQASRAAQSLVDRGLVRKDASATDARGVVLSLTPRGARLFERLHAVIARRNDEITGCLDAAERATLDALLDRLLAQAQAQAQGGGGDSDGDDD